MTTRNFDNSIRQKISIQSIPQSPTDWLEVTSPSIPGGSQLTIVATTTPDNQDVSLWNFLFSIRVDTNTDDYLYPLGASLTSAERDLTLEHWVDYATSDDQSNIRKHYIRIKNNDASAHVYYLLYKSYTFAATPGGTA